MDNSLYFYIEANIVCIITSLVLIFRELRNVDKQVRNLEFVKTICIYSIFYVVEIIWCLCELKIINETSFLRYIVYFFIFFVFTYGSYQWFVYSEVAQSDSCIYKLKNRIKWAIPFCILSIFFLVYTFVIYFTGTEKDLKLYLKILNLFLVLMSFFYEAMSSIKSLRRVVLNKKHPGKSWYFFMGINPIIFSSFIIFQITFVHIPIFCFLNTILMLCFYLKSLDDVISVDSLTKLNNRNQLIKYFHQLHEENGYKNYVLVIDIDNFKSINDKHGHLEGDNALKLVADTFKEVFGKYKYKSFISRYGGDEFVFIVQAPHENDILLLKNTINDKISVNSEKFNKPYVLTVSIGFTRIESNHEKLEHSLAIADKEMYLEKQKKAAARK